MIRCSFSVNGNPNGQPRARAYSRGGRAGVYDPGTADDWKYAVRKAATENAPDKKLEGPVRLELYFYFQRPKRLLKKSSPPRAIPHTGKPDLDNLVKAVKDAITNSGVVWNDDSQVWSTLATKKYLEMEADVPGVVVYIMDGGT